MQKRNEIVASLQHLLDFDARRITSAETQLRNSLPEWITTASSLKLKTVLQKYLDFVRQHLKNMLLFFAEEQVLPHGIDNRVMQALLEEATGKLSHCTDAEVRDACLLACVQGINHFKISAYGTVATLANALGMEKSATIFHEAELNEKHIDDCLSQLAQYEINIGAKATPLLSLNK